MCGPELKAMQAPFFISSFSVGLFFSDAWPKFRAFNCAVLFGYLLAMVWCAYWAISYVFPAIAAIVMTALYMDIRTDDQQTSKKTIIAAIVAWFFSGFVISILFSKSGYETDLKNQEYANQAIEIAPIKAVDCKTATSTQRNTVWKRCTLLWKSPREAKFTGCAGR